MEIDTPRTEYFFHNDLTFKERTIEYIDYEISKINLNELFDNLLNDSKIDRVCLTVLIELLYYKDLIVKKKENTELSTFLTMMRNYEKTYSTVCYLYIMNRVEKYLFNKTESLDNLGMYN